MKKRITTFFLAIILAFGLLSFVACTDQYEEYLGTYECIYITQNGTNMLYMYEYYTIVLGRGRECTATFKMSVSPYTSGTTKSKFDIEGENFIETTLLGLKNEYKYIDGVIIMEYSSGGINLVARFAKTVV